MTDHPDQSRGDATAEDIAVHLQDYLRETPGVCAEGNVNGWRWLRFHDGDWQAAKYYTGDDRLRSYVEGAVLDDASVLDWLLSKPVTLIPESDAYRLLPSDGTVWEDADQQAVFTDADRCVWCGCSERTHDLTSYETTEDGVCLLCADCHESWENADQIVASVPEVAHVE